MLPTGPRYALDVECVSTGRRHDERAVAQISLVNEEYETVVNVYVQPAEAVVSYLTPLTGLTADVLEREGVSLSEALERLHAALPAEAILCGWGLHHDLEWCRLRQGEHFHDIVDVQKLYNVWNERYGNCTHFALSHAVRRLFGGDSTYTKCVHVPSWKPSRGSAHAWMTGLRAHDSRYDAGMSLLLYEVWEEAKKSGKVDMVKRVLEQGRPEPSFRVTNPVFEGVCMGNRKLCCCGAELERW